jgi:hypothetical protein
MWPQLVEFAKAPEYAMALEEAGLGLIELEAIHLYQATPVNTVTFAHSGVGGTHVGFLATPRTPLDASPVVLTAPLADEPNVVVAGSLHEFLSLGCRQGWSFLDQFAHDLAWAVEWYETAGAPAYPVLEDLTRQFGLTPWTDVGARIAVLAKEHRERLIVRPPDPEEDEWA